MVLSKDRKSDIVNLYSYFEAERRSGKLRTRLDRTILRVAEALKIKYKTVDYVCKSLGKSSACAVTPPKAKMGRKPRLDAFDQDVVRQRANRMITERKVVSVKALQESLSQDSFTVSKSLIYRTLISQGFKYKKTADNKKCLSEGYDTIAQRSSFLRKIKHCREEGREIIYTDETWVNAHHTRSSQWFSPEGKGCREPPSGKGQRLIILHAGSEERGFLPGCGLVFRSGSGKAKAMTEDYHDDMNSKVFMKWYTDSLLPVLARPSAIIIDNASYHNIRVPGTETPTSAWRKGQIKAWLEEQNIAFGERMLKPELYAIARRHKPQIQYLTDQLAEAAGHVVIRTPVRHWIFNAIEEIWAQVKDYVAVHNRTFRLPDVEKLVPEAFDNVTVDNWKAAVRSARKKESFYWEADGLRFSEVQPVVVNLSDSDDSDTDGESDSESDSD